VFAKAYTVEMPSLGSWTLETTALFGIAIEAARDIKAAPRIGGQRAALISIVFSVIALEAFMNEIAEQAGEWSNYQPTVEGPEVVLLAEIMGDAEESHARLEFKLRLANWILSGKKVNKGVSPYQDLTSLIHLRNRLVHTEPNRFFIHGKTTNEEAHKDLMKKFTSKKILANDKHTGSWTYLVQTKAVAEWSCRTAAQVVSDLCDGVPACNFKKILDFVREAFESHVARL
jgi:hypothetical protein